MKASIGDLLKSAVVDADLGRLKALLATTTEIGRDALGDALSNAADLGQVEAVESLLGAGADPDWRPVGASRGYPLAQGIHWVWLPVVERLLEAGASIEARGSKGRTALHDAVFAEVDLATEDPPRADLTQLLIDHGADVFARMPSRETASDLAMTLNHPVAEQLLRERMAELTSSRRSAPEQ